MTPRLQACQQALDLTRQMLAQASEAHWDALEDLQHAREVALQPLADAALPRSTEEAACLKELLQRQSELSLLVAQRKDDLSRLLNTHKTGRLMSKVYGLVSGREELL